MAHMFPEFMRNFRWESNTPMSSLGACLIACGLFPCLVRTGQNFMAGVVPPSVNTLLALHNAVLCAFSLIVLLSVLWIVGNAYAAGDASVHDLICDPARRFDHGALYFLNYVFYLSKFYEMLDTAFLVVKRKPVSFLHLFHHLITPILSWAGMSTGTSYQWVATMTNTLVHTLMYYYYTLAALGGKRWWAKYLTTLQIAQFIFNLLVLLSWMPLHLNSPVGCAGSAWSWGFCVFVIASFLLLFTQLYDEKYNTVKRTKKTE